MGAPKGHPPYNTKGEGGRPTEFTDEEIEKYAEELIEWMDVPENVWFKDFLLSKRLHSEYLSLWSKQNKRFSVAHKLAVEKQESKLLNYGLVNQFNASLVKFALTNNHGWSEKTEQKISGDATNPLPIWLVQIDGQTKDVADESSTDK